MRLLFPSLFLYIPIFQLENTSKTLSDLFSSFLEFNYCSESERNIIFFFKIWNEITFFFTLITDTSFSYGFHLFHIFHVSFIFTFTWKKSSNFFYSQSPLWCCWNWKKEYKIFFLAHSEFTAWNFNFCLTPNNVELSSSRVWIFCIRTLILHWI
jgi:hypothetical protein